MNSAKLFLEARNSDNSLSQKPAFLLPVIFSDHPSLCLSSRCLLIPGKCEFNANRWSADTDHRFIPASSSRTSLIGLSVLNKAFIIIIINFLGLPRPWNFSALAFLAASEYVKKKWQKNFMIHCVVRLTFSPSPCVIVNTSQTANIRGLGVLMHKLEILNLLCLFQIQLAPSDF